MPRTTEPRESDTEQDADRKVDERLKRPGRDDDEYAEPERVSRSGDPSKRDEVDEIDELADDDLMEELAEDDLRHMEGPDA